MLNKKSSIRIFIFLTILFAGNLFAQDSWTESWQLIWEYDNEDVVNDTVTNFDMYKGLTTNPTKRETSVTSSARSWRDHDIQPNTSYYYRVTARNNKDVSSEYSESVSAAIPYIMATMDTFYIKNDTSIYLNDYVVDKDYDESQYQDSLSWWINDLSFYTSQLGDYTITISKDDSAIFNVISDSFQLDKVYFTVYDPDSFYYKKETIIKYVSNFIPQPPDTTQPPDSTYGELIVYPIPFRSAVDTYITFDNIPQDISIYIYDVMGGLVFKIEDLSERRYQWNVKNNSGRNINSGLYIYHIRDKGGSKLDSGKVVIIR